MGELYPPVRRIVTANTPDGRSYIAEDGAPSAVRKLVSRPGYRVSNIWVTDGAPADATAPNDGTAELSGLLPPAHGTVFRVIEFPPEPATRAELDDMLRATFAELYGDQPHDISNGPHPGMHRTPTVDYAVVLDGEIHAVFDSEETVMRAGDILIQRDTNHAWSNRSGKPCRMLFVLIDAAG